MAKNVTRFAFTAVTALARIREIASDSANIVVQRNHGKARQRSRKVSHAQIVRCLQRGTIQEGPFVNDKGNWQVTMFRHAAGEELTCVVVIDLPSRLLVITVIPGRRAR